MKWRKGIILFFLNFVKQASASSKITAEMYRGSQAPIFKSTEACKQPNFSMFIGGLNTLTTVDEIRAQLEGVAPIAALKLIPDPIAPHLNRGFCFFSPECPSLIPVFLSKTFSIRGRTLRPQRRDREAASQNESQRVFVGGLPLADVDDNELSKIFQIFGTVRSAYSINDFVTGRSRGYGFVDFLDAESARNAIGALGLVYKGFPLDVRAFKKKGERTLPTSGTPLLQNLSPANMIELSLNNPAMPLRNQEDAAGQACHLESGATTLSRVIRKALELDHTSTNCRLNHKASRR